MSKIQNYFSTLILCIIMFGFLQAISFMATILIQLFSIFIIIYGIIGCQLWLHKFKKDKGDNNANS